ncbi:hypothetical protein NL676_013946 [Syzygium grande]|nr:hypothetical protein NL676_013946 [Syzygium grande]
MRLKNGFFEAFYQTDGEHSENKGIPTCFEAPPSQGDSDLPLVTTPDERRGGGVGAGLMAKKGRRVWPNRGRDRWRRFGPGRYDDLKGFG